MDLSAHPCFDAAARHEHSRAHLPVATGCNVQCNYCDRRFDCANEARPGLASKILTPSQAAAYVDELRTADPTLSVVGIAGPGDPLANPEVTLETLRRVRERNPGLLLCLATNGLALPAHLDALVSLRVGHVTVTVNAVDPEIAARIYAWVREGGNRRTGRAAGEVLWRAQAAGIRALSDRGVLVKVNCVLIPGVNEQHVAEVARRVAELGAVRFNCLPLHPVATTPFGNLTQPSQELLRTVRREAGAHLEQMEHCSRCRADAVGRVGGAPSLAQLHVLARHASSNPEQASRDRPYVAVASHEGIFVNRHLGACSSFFVFGRSGSGAFELVEERGAPAAGSGDERWRAVARVLADCRALLTHGVGARPAQVLATAGLVVLETEGLIQTGLAAVYAGRSPTPPRRDRFDCGKGVDCAGTGAGCG